MCDDRQNEMQLTSQACLMLPSRRNAPGELIWFDCRQAAYITGRDSLRSSSARSLGVWVYG